jgi:hypothetical protein
MYLHNRNLRYLKFGDSPKHGLQATIAESLMGLVQCTYNPIGWLQPCSPRVAHVPEETAACSTHDVPPEMFK